MNRLIAACLLPAVWLLGAFAFLAILSGCAGLTAVEPLLGSALGGLGGGGGSTTLTLHIDQAHGDLTMGTPPALTLTPVGTPITPGSPITPTAPPSTPPVVVTPMPPTSGSPTPVPLPPISAPNPVPVVP